MNASISIPGSSSKRLSPGCSILPNSLKASGVCEASISSCSLSSADTRPKERADFLLAYLYE